eukprot:scaffold56255_cov31-Tisochrysis_lutea.AAC.4
MRRGLQGATTRPRRSCPMEARQERTSCACSRRRTRSRWAASSGVRGVRGKGWAAAQPSHF